MKTFIVLRTAVGRATRVRAYSIGRLVEMLGLVSTRNHGLWTDLNGDPVQIIET